VTDLRTVAMSDYYPMSLLYYAHEVLAGSADSIELFLGRSFTLP